MIPRGIRLQNPGNIRRNHIAWLGESTLQDDPDFLRFTDPEYGIRAIMKILINYQLKEDIEHVQGIISRWAPTNENNTDAYIKDVAAHVGVKPTAYLDVEVPENLIRLAQAIAHHENGKCPDPTLPWWYPDETYEAAAGLALGQMPPVIT